MFSKYAFIVKNNENYDYITIYSALNGAVMNIRRDIMNKIIEYVNNKSTTSDEQLLSVINKLKETGVIIENEGDDRKFLEKAISILKSRREIDLLINTTRRCNLRCIYCYETPLQEDLNEKVVKQLPNFINWLISRKNANKLLLGFYGGEPLLRKDLIYRILDDIELHITGNVKVKTGLITNGTLLTKDVVNALRQFELTLVQVTVDGPREIHNERRPYASGKETFNDIMENILETVDYIPLLQIRVNVDKRNITNVNRLLDELENLGLKRPNVRIYFARVYAATESNKEYRDNCIYKDYKELVRLALEARKRGFNVIYSDYPIPKYIYCAAFTDTHFIIDVNGDLYSCLGGIGYKEYIVGNILYNPPINVEKHALWVKRSPLSLHACINCLYAPLCGGGCGSEAIGYNGDLYSPSCPPQRNTWDNMLIPLREIFKLPLRN